MSEPQEFGIQFIVLPQALELIAVPWLPLTHAFHESLSKISALAAEKGLALDYETVRMEVRPEKDVLRDTGVYLQMRTSVMTQ